VGASLTTYVAQAQQVQSLWNQVQTLCQNISALAALTTQSSAQTAWNGMATATQVASGDIGAPDVTGGSGTAAVNQNSPLVTFSTSQSGLGGSYIVFLGDSTNGQYLVAGGVGASWQLVKPYLGPNLSTAAWATITPNNAHPISVGTPPLLMSANDLSAALSAMSVMLGVMNGTGTASSEVNRLAAAPSLVTLST
jgi:hypothetical protein